MKPLLDRYLFRNSAYVIRNARHNCHRYIISLGDIVVTRAQHEKMLDEMVEHAERLQEIFAQCTPARYTLTDRSNTQEQEPILAPEIFTKVPEEVCA